ncbi:hypothetical protein CBOM_01080 [Ceraceosorus bombacis]|uniref:Uncharacterized protein n=1 Tax=Ceraceosorus bombacis TaxID=401625 RepID=A0A0P1BCP0_9BASI|nr:hypothetical protein CBOM_01080 [Ceraceosorus bombacis]
MLIFTLSDISTASSPPESSCSPQQRAADLYDFSLGLPSTSITWPSNDISWASGPTPVPSTSSTKRSLQWGGTDTDLLGPVNGAKKDRALVVKYDDEPDQSKTDDSSFKTARKSNIEVASLSFHTTLANASCEHSSSDITSSTATARPVFVPARINQMSEVQKLKAEISALRAAMRFSDVREDLLQKRLEASQAETTNAVEMGSKHRLSATKLSTQLKEKDKEIQSLNKELRLCKDQILEDGSQIEKLEDMVRTLEDEVKKLKLKDDERKGAVKKLEEEVKKLKLKDNERKGAVQKLEEEVKKPEAKDDERKEKIKTLKIKDNERKGTVKKLLQKRLEASQAETANAVEMGSKHRPSATKLSTQLEEKDKEIQSLNEELRLCNNQILQDRSHIEKLEDKVGTLKDEVKNLKLKDDERKGTVKKLKAKDNERKEKIKNVEDKVEELVPRALSSTEVKEMDKAAKAIAAIASKHNTAC